MGIDENGRDRAGLPEWLREPWQSARRRSLPLCLMLVACDHAEDDTGAEQLAAALPSDAFGPYPLAADRFAVALTATSPESAYQSAYHVHRALTGDWRVGLAMAAPRRDAQARALLRHAGDALERARDRGDPIQGMDVILS